MSVPGLDALLSDEGWPYASTQPVEPGDPGRFHALFGRDSLITSLQVLPARPEVAGATLRALAALQGAREDPATGEEPGKIGHEFRARPPEPFVRAGWPEAGGFRYYGTADATSWFLVVLAATGDAALACELDAAWRGAGDWLARALDSGEGLVRHEPGTLPGGLTQQGWRDAIDPAARSTEAGGFLRPDGAVPGHPLADVDSQAAAHAALLALAALSGEGDWRRRAAALRERLGALGPDAVAVEAGDEPVPGAGSQLGWLLWAGALEGEAREAAAERLCASDVLTDYGLRTLSSESPVFHPHAYHRGSILAVRLLARLGRAARGRPRGGGRARARRRAGGARPARPAARALRGHRGRGA